MKERPILFSGPMVRAILEGRKTQTRRVMKADLWFAEDPAFGFFPDGHSGPGIYCWESEYPGEGCELIKCPYGKPGDRLWVRETWAWPGEEHLLYRATDQHVQDLMRTDPNYPQFSWRPSIHMPRWASRITLEIIGVRVERLQEISEPDSRAEGVDHEVQAFGGYVPEGYYRSRFSLLWNSINKARGFGWDVNPWVWVIEFKRMETANG